MKIPQRPPPIETLLAELAPDRVGRVLLNGSATTPDGKYRHWDTLRRLQPPDDLTIPEWWLATKFARASMMKRFTLEDSSGEPFGYTLPDSALAMLHTIDQRASGEITVTEVVTNPATRNRYIINSLIEEAIMSSQLEGAVTSRVVAKEMIRSGRRPRNKDERMILNNYRAIQLVRQHRHDPLTPAFVNDLQRVVSEGTLENPADAGQIQQPGDERVRVEATDDGKVVHNPPAAEELPRRLVAMCEFANSAEQTGFLHPVVRAILLHFWLAYDHPFADGNGRTARALFYWSMLNQKYWLSEYLSISRILKKAPGQYGRAFLYSETDGNDATYFVLYQLKVTCRAIDEFYRYLQRKVAEVRDVEDLLKSSTVNFNHRQLALLSHALRQPGAMYTFHSHAVSHNVNRQSARTDLLGLESRRLLVLRKVGRTHTFSAVPDLVSRLREAAQRPTPQPPTLYAANPIRFGEGA